jgi:hypothetical protein
MAMLGLAICYRGKSHFYLHSQDSYRVEGNMDTFSEKDI